MQQLSTHPHVMVEYSLREAGSRSGESVTVLRSPKEILTPLNSGISWYTVLCDCLKFVLIYLHCDWSVEIPCSIFLFLHDFPKSIHCMLQHHKHIFITDAPESARTGSMNA